MCVKAGAVLGHVVCDDEIEILLAQLFSSATNYIVGLSGESYHQQTLVPPGRDLAEYVLRSCERQHHPVVRFLNLAGGPIQRTIVSHRRGSDEDRCVGNLFQHRGAHLCG